MQGVAVKDASEQEAVRKQPKVAIEGTKYLHEYVCPPFRSAGRSDNILKGLFYETLGTKQNLVSPLSDEIGPRPIYTLKPYDHTIPQESVFYRDGGPNLLRSFYEVYVEYGDPSEYSFAMGTLGSWEHWVELRGCQFFKPYYKKMREALKAKIESEALLAARKALKAGIGPQSLQAAKWLRDAVKGPANGRGRPSKEQVQGEIKRQAEEEKDLASDLERLGLDA